MSTKLIEKPNRLKPFLFVAFVAAACIFAVYIARRWTKQPSSLRPYLSDYGDLYNFNLSREGGHLRPNLNILAKGSYKGQRVRVITNSKGFRNAREFDYVVPQGVTRVLFLGDSYVDGMRTDQEKTIGYMLEYNLNEHLEGDQTFEVLIAGQNNPADSWYYFQEHGYKYHPDQVILGVTLGNDLTWHNYKGSVYPTGGAGGGIVLKLVPPVRNTIQNWPDLLLPKDAYVPENYFDFLWDGEMDARRFLAKRHVWFSDAVAPVLGPRSNRRRRVYAAGENTSLGLFYRPNMKAIEGMYSDFEEVLSGFHRLAGRHGSELLVVLFPVRIQVSKKDWKLLRRAYSLDERKFDLTYPNRRIVDFCKKEGISCLDLLPSFNEAAGRGRSSFYRPRGDMHFNELGQALAAEKIGKYILVDSDAGRTT